MDFDLVGKDNITGPVEKATKSLDELQEKAEEAGKKVTKGGKEAKKDWEGVADLFGGLLPRSLTKTIRQFKSTKRSIGRLSKGFKGLKSAIASTGIGLLVVALGELVANWDKITGAITRASSETEDLVAENKELVQAAKDQLSYITDIENILRLQGKTEEDILAYRMQATDEAIAAQRIMIDSLKQQQEEQVKAAETSEKVAQAMIALLSLPITFALAAIDDITGALAELGLMDEGTDYLQAYLDAGTKALGLDAGKIAEDGQEAIDEAEDQLQRLENTRAGYQLRANKNEADAEAKAQKARDDAAKKKEDNAKYLADRLLQIQQDMYLAMIEDDITQQKERRRLQYEADQAELKARGATLSQLLVLKQQYDMDIAAIDQQAQDQKDAKEKERLDKEAQLREELRQKDLTDRQLEEEAAFAEFQRREELAGTNDALVLEAFEAFQKQKEAIAKKYNEKEIEDNQEVIDLEIQGRQALAKGVMGLFKEMGKLGEQNSEQQKRLAIADILLNQAIAMSSAIRGAQAAAAATGPAAPVMTPIFMVQMLGMVLGGFASIKGVLAQAGTSGGSVGGGSGQTRSGFATQNTAPMPARLDSPDMQAYVVQSQLEGQAMQASQLASKTTL